MPVNAAILSLNAVASLGSNKLGYEAFEDRSFVRLSVRLSSVELRGCHYHPLFGKMSLRSYSCVEDQLQGETFDFA